MKNIINILFGVRAYINRTILPGAAYHLFKRDARTTDPISGKFGFDRGTPIDRFWIESFLDKNRRYIAGRVLEVTDSKYTKMFGGNKVLISDVLDINPNNSSANIIGDLRDLHGKIKENTYDCIVLTHVLGLIDDYVSVLKECRRILKRGGTILFTGSCLGPILENNEVYWRFTKKSVKYIFEKHFSPRKLSVESHGNALAGQAFWVGMSQEDLTKEELGHEDDRFPCVIAAVATK